MKRTLALFLAFVAFPTVAAPLKNLCESFEPLRKLDDLPYVKPAILIDPDDEKLKPEDVVFTIAARAGAIRVSPDANWELRLPLTDALCAENPDITSNPPPDSMGVSISIKPKMPPVRSLDYRQLDALREQWDIAVSRQGFMYRMLAPSPKGFYATFDRGHPASAEIRLADGTRKLVADAEGHVLIPFEPSWRAANPAIVFSELPKAIGLRFKG